MKQKVQISDGFFLALLIIVLMLSSPMAAQDTTEDWATMKITVMKSPESTLTINRFFPSFIKDMYEETFDTDCEHEKPAYEISVSLPFEKMFMFDILMNMKHYYQQYNVLMPSDMRNVEYCDALSEGAYIVWYTGETQ